MSHPEIDLMVAMERRRDERAAAEHARLVRLALDAQPDHASQSYLANSQRFALFNRMVLIMGQGLVALGVRLSSWGCRLQVHYASPAGGRQVSSCD